MCRHIISPIKNNAQSLQELWLSIAKIPKNSFIWIFGDFNMPDMDWQTESPTPSCKFKELYENFSENLTNFNLEQMVKIPTRNKKYPRSLPYNSPSVVHNISKHFQA